MPETSITTTAQPPEYSSQIRREIERDVARLIEAVKGYSPEGGWETVYDNQPVPEYILLGYMINMHRGYSLYEEGDLIHGLPVRIVHYTPRTISVCADEIEFEREVWDDSGIETGDEKPGYYTEFESRNVVRSIVW